jgi:hypothetical protein
MNRRTVSMPAGGLVQRRHGSSSSTSDTSTPTPATDLHGDHGRPGGAPMRSVPRRHPLPIVDQIDQAVAALEAETGGPQEYFEINATAQLVNLFVGTQRRRRRAAVAVRRRRRSPPPKGRPASGGTFAGADVAFDPETIFEGGWPEVPGHHGSRASTCTATAQGNVLYGVLATSERGGGLDIVLGPTAACCRWTRSAEAP